MEEKKDLGPVLNWKQAIRLLACSKSQFYKLVDAEAFPNAYRLGTKGIRVPQADIEDFKERRRVSG